ncbi:transposase [Microbulbifer sp. JMSA004]|uniref:transposase n=1 Tax=Microbulbifer sp. JMSA004 TaxID=3243370 RepID=UPI004039F8B7
MRHEIGVISQNLYRQKAITLVEGYVMRNHIFMLLMISAEFNVSYTLGFLKRKFVIQILREYGHIQRNFRGDNSGLSDVA